MKTFPTRRIATIAVAFVAAAVPTVTAVPAHADDDGTYLVRGRVVSAVTHTPLPGVCVRQESTDHWSSDELARAPKGTGKVLVVERAAPTRSVHYGTSDDCLGGVFTDATGRYELVTSAWTMTDVTATDYAGTFVRSVVGLANGEPGTVTEAGDTTMKVGGTITGKAVDAVTGLPVEGACPSAIRGNGTSTGELSLAVVRCSGRDGTWSLTGLAQGRYRVSLTAFGYGVRYAPTGTTLKAGKAYRAVAGSAVAAGTVNLLPE